MSDRPLTTGEGTTASHLHPHEPEQPPLLGADGRCFVCALSVSQDEVARLRKQLDAATIGLDLAIVMQDALRMDTPEDEAIRLRGLEKLRLARAILGVEGSCPACENGYICRHGAGCLLDAAEREQEA